MSETVAASELEFSYGAGSRGEGVFRSLSLQIHDKSLTTLMGSSGSGKSTLLYLLSLLLKPSSGEIRWHGIPVSNLSDATRSRLRAGMSGFIFQDAILDPGRTVLENVCESGLYRGMGRLSRQRRALALLDQMGVAHRAHHRPGEVSGGQAQRVALCRALLPDPEIIFADEPTGNLDDETTALVWSELKSRARGGATVIVATHDSRLAVDSDQQVVLA